MVGLVAVAKDMTSGEAKRWRRASRVGCWVLGVGCLVSRVRWRISSVRCRVSSVRCSVLSVGCRASGERATVHNGSEQRGNDNSHACYQSQDRVSAMVLASKTRSVERANVGAVQCQRTSVQMSELPGTFVWNVGSARPLCSIRICPGDK